MHEYMIAGQHRDELGSSSTKVIHETQT